MSSPIERGDGDAVRGVRTAVVRDNEDPEDLGRVRVGYPWTDDEETYWARIATEMTGPGYGTYFLPEVDDEVLVAFEAGAIESPYVVGSLWSPNQDPPADNADGDNDVRTVVSRSGHRVEFDDSSSGSVAIESAGGHEVVLDDEAGSESIRIEDSGENSVELDATDGDVSISAGGTIRLDAGRIELSADDDVAVDGKSIDLSGQATVTVSSTGQLTLESSGLGKLESAGPLQIKGGIITLN